MALGLQPATWAQKGWVGEAGDFRGFWSWEDQARRGQGDVIPRIPAPMLKLWLGPRG